MSLRQRIWANKAKARLISELGGVCSLCGAEEDLEIDHPNGREWRPNRVEFSNRISRYRREARLGLVRVLCAACNKDPANQPRYRETVGVVTSNPF